MKSQKNITGRKIAKLRKAAGLSVEELVRLVASYGGELSAAEIERIEAGDRRVLDDEVLFLAHALGVGLEALFPKRRK